MTPAPGGLVGRLHDGAAGTIPARATRHELHHGRFSRTRPLPESVTESDVSATYGDGILEIAVRMSAEEHVEEPRRIPVTKG